MVKISCKVNNLKELLKLVKLEGKDPDGSTTIIIDNCILNCGDGKVGVNVLAKTGTILEFLEYKKIDVINKGEIPIGNIEVMLSYLSRFDNEDIISLETTENKIKITRDKPRKIALIPLTARENIDDSLRAEAVKDCIKKEEKGWKFRNTLLTTNMRVDVNFIKQVLDDGSVQGLNRKYPFIIDESVSCRVGDERGGMIESVIEVEKKEGKAKSSYAAGIDSVFSNLDGVVDVFIVDNGPMLVMKDDDKYNIKIVIAPLIDEE